MTTSQDRNERWSLDNLMDACVPDMHREQVLALVGEAFDAGAAEAHAQYRPAVDEDGDSIWLHACGQICWKRAVDAWPLCSKWCKSAPETWRRLYIRDRNLESDPPNPSSAAALAVEVERLRTERDEARGREKHLLLLAAFTGQGGVDPQGYYAGTPGTELRRLLAVVEAAKVWRRRGPRWW